MNTGPLSYPLEAAYMDKGELEKFFNAIGELMRHRDATPLSWLYDPHYYDAMAEAVTKPGQFSTYNISEKLAPIWDDNRILIPLNGYGRFFVGPYTRVYTGPALHGGEDWLFRMDEGLFYDAGRWGSL